MVADHGICDHDLGKEIETLAKTFIFVSRHIVLTR